MNKNIEFGIGMFGDVTIDPKTGHTQSMQDRLLQIVEQVKLADELWVDLFAVGEHHRSDFAVSSPEILLAALSTVTKKIKLSSWVSVISSTDPVKLYQDFATVDLLSWGRAEIMPGRWSFIESFPLFGYDLQNYDELFIEKLNLLLDIMSNEELTWSWKFRAPLDQQNILPRALNNGKMPVWIAVWGTASSIIRAAKMWLPIIFAIIGGRREQFEPLIELYKVQYQQSGHDINNIQIWVHAHTFIASSQQELIDNYYPLYAAQMDRIGKSRWRSHYTLDQFLWWMSRDGALCIWTPEQVADKITKMIQKFGLTRFVAHIDIGGPTHNNLMNTIELYSREVIPIINKQINK